MKLIKKASGKTTVKMSKNEWKAMGKKAGWIRMANKQVFFSELMNLKKGLVDLLPTVQDIMNHNWDAVLIDAAVNGQLQYVKQLLENFSKYPKEVFHYIPSINDFKEFLRKYEFELKKGMEEWRGQRGMEDIMTSVRRYDEEGLAQNTKAMIENIDESAQGNISNEDIQAFTLASKAISDFSKYLLEDLINPLRNEGSFNQNAVDQIRAYTPQGDLGLIDMALQGEGTTFAQILERTANAIQSLAQIQDQGNDSSGRNEASDLFFKKIHYPYFEPLMKRLNQQKNNLMQWQKQTFTF